MFEYFGHSIEGLPCPSIDEVFRSVEAGAAEFGVVPVENSAEGAVSRTLDLLLQTSLTIGGELALPIHHNLLTRLATLDRRDARVRASAGARTMPALADGERAAAGASGGIEQCGSGAMAVEDPTVAAIAGDRAATHYGLGSRLPLIQDDPHNRTRFVMIGKQPTGASGHDQTSLIVSVANEPGAMFKLLEPLAHHGVSMTRFESRPARVGTWEYYFYIDVEGHRDDPAVAAALAELGEKAAFLKILGSYPRAR